MSAFAHLHKHIVAACLAAVWISGPASAQSAAVDDFLNQLQDAEPAQAERIVDAILSEWSKSGSAAVDLLYRRGQDAISARDYVLATEHLTAAIDHAPEFAEAYSARANAYYRLNMIGPALDDLGRVLVLNPQNFIALRGFAVILEELERPEEALELYGRSLALFPGDTDALEAQERIRQDLLGAAL